MFSIFWAFCGFCAVADEKKVTKTDDRSRRRAVSRQVNDPYGSRQGQLPRLPRGVWLVESEDE